MLGSMVDCAHRLGMTFGRAMLQHWTLDRIGLAQPALQAQHLAQRVEG